MMVTCIKQHLSNIWSSINEKVKEHWGWVELKKSFAYKKSVQSEKLLEKQFHELTVLQWMLDQTCLMKAYENYN